jgi:hypothetical protein
MVTVELRDLIQFALVRSHTRFDETLKKQKKKTDTFNPNRIQQKAKAQLSLWSRISTGSCFRGFFAGSCLFLAI